jgi:hypothetical protein
MYTVLCAFEDRQAALRSITRMIRTGLPRDDIHVQPIVVHVSDAEEALEAATLMTDLGAFDVEHCRTRWKSGGYGALGLSEGATPS